MSGSAFAESRLARMISRLTTQRRCLERGAALIADVPGPVFEVGLGKGRTFDHLRRLLPDRELFAFDRDVHAPEDCVPDAGHLILGDFLDTLPEILRRFEGAVALIHADIGSEDRAADARLATRLAEPLARLLHSDGVLITDREMNCVGLHAIPLAQDNSDWPYFMYFAETREG